MSIQLEMKGRDPAAGRRKGEGTTRICSVRSCEEPVFAVGYCEAHYHRNRRTGSPEGAAGRVCRVPGCGRPHYGRGLCDLHRSQAEEKASGEGNQNRNRTKYYEIFG